MIAKKIPGADWAYMVYDKRDRLAFVQDGNMRTKSIPQWLCTLYDELNRPMQTAMMIYNISRTDLQNYVNSLASVNTQIITTDNNSTASPDMIVGNRQSGRISYRRWSRFCCRNCSR